MAAVKIERLQFKYSSDSDFSLSIPHFELEDHAQLFLQGPSGAGKTTFLNLVTGLLKPDEGCVSILNKDICQLSQAQTDRYRADCFGIIFQMFNLIPYLSVLDNITLPCAFSVLRRQTVLKEAASLEDEARRLCGALDLDLSLLSKSVNHLSIGQQQRVAIARAVIGKPRIIIADEPTSALDQQRRNDFVQFLKQEIQAIGAALIFVSHDESLKNNFDRVLDLAALQGAQE